MTRDQIVTQLALFYDYALHHDASSHLDRIEFFSEGCQIKLETIRDNPDYLLAAREFALREPNPIIDQHRSYIRSGKGYAQMRPDQLTEKTQPLRDYAEFYRRSVARAVACISGPQSRAEYTHAPLAAQRQSSDVAHRGGPAAPVPDMHDAARHLPTARQAPPGTQQSAATGAKGVLQLYGDQGLERAYERLKSEQSYKYASGLDHRAAQRSR